MKLKSEKFEELISNKNILEKSLEKTKLEYRLFDPGQYLYSLLLEKRRNLDIFSDEYLELSYTTLIAWNMNGRAAKLNEIELFKESIRSNKENMTLLNNYRIENLSKGEFEKTINITESLFKKLDLVGESWTGNKIKSKLVTFSKTMHFLLPNLYVPIDRRYTLNFFYNNKTLQTDKNNEKNDEKQLVVFNELFKKFHSLTEIYNLNEYKDNKWNKNIPKTIDNAIIGYSKLSKGL
ncbi:hypothetical protein CMO90_00875 [Candidatus Woesearchaeota archaeon]|jgi:hypothetical protein|nr:hypothetical protein [Candidatus Woesearchaeota archaeon]